jgi:molybdopterin-containing oxidoreductase family iron-sulfur binding subunit
MTAGEIATLLIIDANPAYDAPADLSIAGPLDRVPLRVHMGLYYDETADLCHWHIPRAHDLESWSDARAFDGTATIMQPLIAPLYSGRTIQELLAMLRGDALPNALGLVRSHWQSRMGLANRSDFESWWRTTLRRGTVGGTRTKTMIPPKLDIPGAISRLSRELTEPDTGTVSGHFELCLTPDPTIHDGRFSNNAWLQELPKPITKLTWDNALLVSPATSHFLDIKSGDVVELSQPGADVSAFQSATVLIQPGHADNCATLSLGYGRTRAGAVGSGRGSNAYALRSTGSPWMTRITIRKTKHSNELAISQQGTPQAGDLAREVALVGFLANPAASTQEDKRTVHLSMYPRHRYSGTQWGMSIDTGLCVGCSACITACQAENNVPVVGKDQVMRGRVMHWIRVDRYYNGPPASPRALFAPIPCMHCEDAPCELVCPVGATQHSEDGLNEMIYNRCIGTRYCSNNCPYKVRRFNFYRYADATTEQLKLLRNPDVSVRSRGVMEKCTYCVQRIRATEIAARKENRSIRRGEVVTACQQACPAGAIVFGNINDEDDSVARDKSQPHNYAMLADLNTHPRTTYLAAVRNLMPISHESH